MSQQLHAIANEFDSYMQDRAKRLGYRVRMVPFDAACVLPVLPVLPVTARFALVEFRETPHGLPPDHGGANLDRGMDTGGDAGRGHLVAWSEPAGSLVQLNVLRNEAGNRSGHEVPGRVGVRTFAEEFFADVHRRSLSVDEFSIYVDWLAAQPGNTAASPATVAVRLPCRSELVLSRLPSAAMAVAWSRRNVTARAGGD